MFSVDFQWDKPIGDVGARIDAAVALKLTDITRLLHEKVLENVGGKILQKQSGQLSSSVQTEVITSGEIMSGSVFISPETPKAWALEKGGDGFYPIVPTKASILRWINKGGVKMFAKEVSHPPSKAFHYLAEALQEIAPTVPEEFQRVIQEAIDAR